MRASSPAPAATPPTSRFRARCTFMCCARRTRTRASSASRPAPARAMPGVRLVLTGADLAAAGLGPLPCPVVVNTVGSADRAGAPRPGARPRAPRRGAGGLRRGGPRGGGAGRGGGDRGRLRALCPPRSTAAPRSPPARRRSGRRRPATKPSASNAATARRWRPAFARAAHVVSLDLVNQRLHAAPIEPRAAIGRHDAGDRRLRPRAERPGRPHHPRPARPLRAPRPGGAGPPVLPRCRRRLRPEELPLPRARAGVARRPPAGPPRALGGGGLGGVPGRRSCARPAEARCDSPSTRRGGSWPPRRYGGQPRRLLLRLRSRRADQLPFQRDVHRLRRARRRCWRCAAPSPTPCRWTPIAAPASPKPTTMMERLVDAAARRCGFDPVALRRRNLVTHIPAPQRLRDTMDGGGFAQALDAAEALADRAGFAARRAESEGARQAARPRPRLLPGNRARLARRMGGGALRRGRHRRPRHRHPVERPGA